MIVHNALGALARLDELPDLPYGRVPMERYLHRNYLGRRTVAYNSSVACKNGKRPYSVTFTAETAPGGTVQSGTASGTQKCTK